jgi:hypothetical protein
VSKQKGHILPDLIVGDTLTWKFLKKTNNLQIEPNNNKNDLLSVEIKQIFYGYKDYIKLYSHGSIERSKSRSKAHTNAYINCRINDRLHYHATSDTGNHRND